MTCASGDFYNCMTRHNAHVTENSDRSCDAGNVLYLLYLIWVEPASLTAGSDFPVVQRIERGFPKPETWVQVPPGKLRGVRRGKQAITISFITFSIKPILSSRFFDNGIEKIC